MQPGVLLGEKSDFFKCGYSEILLILEFNDQKCEYLYMRYDRPTIIATFNFSLNNRTNMEPPTMQNYFKTKEEYFQHMMDTVVVLAT